MTIGEVMARLHAMEDDNSINRNDLEALRETLDFIRKWKALWENKEESNNKPKYLTIKVTETKTSEFMYKVSNEEYRQIMDEGKDLFEVITDQVRIDDLLNNLRIDALNDYDAECETDFEVIRRR